MTINVYADSNEQSHERVDDLLATLANDTRFTWFGYEDLPVDLCFKNIPKIPDFPGCNWECGEQVGYQPTKENCEGCNCQYSRTKTLYVELKEPYDYISSILNKAGHLWDQVQTMRELGQSAVIVVLGGDKEISGEIEMSALGRKTNLPKDQVIAANYALVRNFESSCIALGIPVFRWSESPMKRILSLADKALNEPNMLQFRPKAADNEREIAATTCLFSGIGPEYAKRLLENYDICFQKRPGGRELSEIKGFGPKKIEMIGARLHV